MGIYHYRTLEIRRFLIKMPFLKKNMVFQKKKFGSKNSREHSPSDEGILNRIYKPISKLAFLTEFILTMAHSHNRFFLRKI